MAVDNEVADCTGTSWAETAGTAIAEAISTADRVEDVLGKAVASWTDVGRAKAGARLLVPNTAEARF